MNSKILSLLIVLALVLPGAVTVRAQSLSYSNTIASLNPAGYWPMHEVEAPVPGDIETNYGTLGLLGTAYYPDYQVNVGAIIRSLPGPLANGTDQGIFFTGPAGGGTATNGVLVPRTSPLAVLKPPFTVECWMMATNIGTGQGDIWSQADGSKATGIRVYYQNSTGDQISVLTYPSGQINFANFTTNQWHHLVVTCSATTNFSTWFDGVAGATLAAAGKYTYDTHTPFTMGTGLGFQRAFHGLESEVAVYTNVITDVATHYNDGINAGASASQYFSDVINDNPVIYLRLSNAGYAAPAGPWPALANYGQTNGVAIGGGFYTPGTLPGNLAAASYNNFPVGLISTNVAQLSGVSSFADAGYAPAYNPAGPAPFSVTALFRGNPADTNRVQSIAGHGTNSWELGLTAAGWLVFNSGTNSASVVATGSGAGDLVSTNAAPNNGSWHVVTAVHNGTTNVLYLDGVANNTNVLGAANNVGNSLDVMVGSDPCYTNTPVGLGRQFAGQICEVAFFTNALTPAQVQSLYNYSGTLPKLTQQPVSATVNEGSVFTNTVAATGSTPLSYQWYANGVPVGGATNASLIFNPVLPAEASPNYYLVLTNNFGAVTSSVVSLTVYGAPVFTSQLPQPYTNVFTLYAGVSPTFSVALAGPQPIACQWYTNAVAVGGATNTSLTLSNVAAGLLSSDCVASNIYGASTSLVWTAMVVAAPAAPYPLAVLADRPAAYWRLNDTNEDGIDNGSGDDGYVCHDYVNGYDGIYTNVILGQSGYNPGTDPAETSAAFDEIATANCDANSIQGLDFTTPAGSNAEYTVSAWVNGLTISGTGGIVSKGYFYGEELNLDCGAANRDYRFEVRSAAGTVYNANSTVSSSDQTWHHLVGVCDELNSSVLLYIDGSLAATSSIPALSGITNSATVPIIIGSRPTSATSGANNQFGGYIDDVAIFKYAMNAAQVAALFGASGTPPFITQQPAGANVNYGANYAVAAVVSGTAPLFCQWFDVNAGSYLAGQTNATLLLTNVTLSDSYYLTVTNLYGTTNSTTVSLNVVSGKPQIFTDVQNPFYGIEGRGTGNSVAANGTAPLVYQWQFFNGTSWVNLTDGGRLSGSSSPALNIASTYPADAGNYQVVITNIAGSTTSSVATLIVAGLPVNFYGSGLYWTANGSARLANGLLSLTDPNNGGGGGTYFFQYPQYIGSFEASFTYQAGGNKAADGFTFCLQNDPRGPAAIGSGGGGLEVGNGSMITPSAELEFNIYPGNGVGYAFETNGFVPAAGGFTAPGSVSINSGDPINVTVNYASGQLALTIADAVAGTSYATNLVVGDLTRVLGNNTAYVGFTGAYGGSTSVQTITNFTFLSTATQAIQVNNRASVQVSWPGPILGYLLQQNSDLTTTNWLNVTNPDNVVNSQHQVTLPFVGTNQFYRLMLQQ